MKTAKFFSCLFIVVCISLLFSCSRENLDYGSTSREMITAKQWSVDYYFAGQDKTAQYDDYKLSFIGDGTLNATSGTSVVTGNWSMITDASRNDVLRISISEAHLQGMNEQWTVNLSSDVVTLKGVGSEMRLRKL